jgi:hypothetical protein
MSESPPTPRSLPSGWLTILHTIWNYVGPIRSEKRLNHAMRLLRELDLEIAPMRGVKSTTPSSAFATAY